MEATMRLELVGQRRKWAHSGRLFMVESTGVSSIPGDPFVAVVFDDGARMRFLASTIDACAPANPQTQKGQRTCPVCEWAESDCTCKAVLEEQARQAAQTFMDAFNSAYPSIDRGVGTSQGAITVVANPGLRDEHWYLETLKPKVPAEFRYGWPAFRPLNTYLGEAEIVVPKPKPLSPWKEHIRTETAIMAKMRAEGRYKPMPPAEPTPERWVCQVMDEDLLADAGTSYTAPK